MERQQTDTLLPRTMKRYKPKDKDFSAEMPISVRVPISSVKLLDIVRQDARIYHTSENRLLGVYVRRAVKRLRDLIETGDLVARLG